MYRLTARITGVIECFLGGKAVHLAAGLPMNKEKSSEKREFTGYRDLREESVAEAINSEPRQPERLGRYEILAELGRGAMGMVYKAHDPRINRPVAIKIIKIVGASPSEAEDYRLRFFREAQAAGRLSHPGIVTIYDVDQDPLSNTPYIVMEYVPGKRLDTFVASQPSERVSLKATLLLVEQIAEALHYAHEQGIVHRDIKPANVIVTGDGSAKIADFGIAKLALTDFTMPGQVLGTPAFMAPEQFTGGTVDGRSDLFSLGVILYWLLTGIRPFTGESATSVSFKLVYQDPVPATTVAPNLPPQFDTVLRRALAKTSAERYQTGEEFAHDIRLLRQGNLHHVTEASDPLDQTRVTVRSVDQKVAAAPAPVVAAKSSPPQARRLRGHTIAAVWQKNAGSWKNAALISAATIAMMAAGLGLHRMNSRGATPSRQQPDQAQLPVKPTAAPTEVIPPALAPGPDPAEPDPVRVSQAKPKPVHAHASPHLVGATIPKTQLVLAAGSPASLAPKVASPAKATLLTVGEYSFRSATISISVDGELAYQGMLSGSRKLPFSGVRGSVSAAVRLAPGSHSIEVHVVSEHDHCDETKKIEGEFHENEQRTLSFAFAGHNSDMQLAWKEAPKTPSPNAQTPPPAAPR